MSVNFTQLEALKNCPHLLRLGQEQLTQRLALCVSQQSNVRVNTPTSYVDEVLRDTRQTKIPVKQSTSSRVALSADRQAQSSSEHHPTTQASRTQEKGQRQQAATQTYTHTLS